MVPAATGEALLMLRHQASLCGVVAAIMEPAAVDDPTTLEADVLAILFPAAALEAVGRVAVQASRATTRTLIRKHVSGDVLKTIVRLAARYLGVRVTQRGLISKSVPIVSGLVGGAWNRLEVAYVGQRAIRYFQDREL